MSDEPAPDAWLPGSVANAGQGATSIDRAAVTAGWEKLMRRLDEAAGAVLNDPGAVNDTDLAAGLRHLQVLLAVGLDEALYADDPPSLRLRPSRATDDVRSWGMDCADAVYTHAALEPGARYRLLGNPGTARYVGLQTMDGQAATANAVADELEIAADGTLELVLSPEEQPGNWLRTAGENPSLVVRHFFYDWDTEVVSDLRLERIDADSTDSSSASATAPLAATAERLGAVGDFVVANLGFFTAFGQAPPVNGFLEPFDQTSIGGAAENRPVIGRWQLEPDQALILEVTPPVGAYWSLSAGNPWWETIHYGRHQSSLNGHQAVLDDDGVFRAVLCGTDPGVANWIDTAGHSNGPMILRCVRTETAPVPSTTLVALSDLDGALPAGTARVTPAERAATLAARRRAIAERFGR